MTYPHDNACPRCKAKYAAGRPESCGSDIQCAFVGGEFSDDNWNCATMNALRDHVPDDKRVWSDDESAAILRDYDGNFLVLSWYKNRGCTQYAMLLEGGTSSCPLTIADVERFLGSKQ